MISPLIYRPARSSLTTGNSLASFLLGQNAACIQVSDKIPPRASHGALQVQHVTDQLTVNDGFRYEVEFPRSRR